MKKFIFISLLVIFLPLFLNAQDNAGQDIIKNNVNSSILENAYSMQELNATLLDQYGLNNVEFVKLENGKYIPIKEKQARELEGKDIQDTQISSETILIFAIIGAILVAVLLIRAI
ncbi:MAG: hypothetical protein WC139_10635 [Candidatus Kapaibacterium sp.]